MRTSRLVTSIFTILVGPGCGHVVDVPEPPETPFIQAILVAGRTAEARVEMLRVGEDEPVQIDPVEVDLALVDQSGTRCPLVPSSGSPGAYQATIAIAPGGRYRLEGTVAGIPVSAETTVPVAFEVEAPADDTIRATPLVDPAGFDLAEVPFRWSASGASAFQIDSATFTLGSLITRATEGRFALPRRAAGSPPGPRIRILALNADADGFLDRRGRPLSNIRGGFGVLGGAVEARRVVAWR